MAEISLKYEYEDENGEVKKGKYVKVLKFAGVGIVATIVDFLVYQFALNVLFSGNLTISAVVSGVIATFAAYVMHNNITWKERDPGKYGVVKFFIWNGIAVFGLRPPLTWFFGMLTGVYEFAYWLLGWVFSYEFIESTGVYILMTLMIMILNYTVYEKLVFTKENGKSGKKVDVKGVRQAGKEEKRKRVGKKQGK